MYVIAYRRALRYNPDMRELPNLDLLRSIAVSLVVLDHMCKFAGVQEVHGYSTGWAGVFGVYFFFVHTSLVLMWSIERQPHVMNFYIRRAFRIYPLSIVAILIALVFRFPVTDGAQILIRHPHYTFKAILANILLVQNLVWQPSVLGVMWTLTIEVQMYILLPALFLYANREKRIWQVLVLWSLAVMVARMFGSAGGNNIVSVVPVFMCGVIAYIAYSKFRARLPAWTFFPFLAVLFACFIRKPGVSISWPLMLILGLSLPLFRSISMKPLVWVSHTVAKYSYGVYLFHFFALYIAFRTLPSHNVGLQIAIALAITIIASTLGYHLVEEPLIRLGSHLAKANNRRESARALTRDAAYLPAVVKQ